MKTKKGFTLLELLIVIGILAILSTTIIIVINPAQLLKRARDSQRISDLNTMKTAIAYYITEETGTLSIGSLFSAQTYADIAGAKCHATATVAPAVAFTTGGSGWIPINFDGLSGGSPIGSLPHDPKITALDADPGRYYVYMVGHATNYTFKLVANMESTMYGSGGTAETDDGGTDATLYEVGTSMTTAIATGTATCYAGTGE